MVRAMSRLRFRQSVDSPSYRRAEQLLRQRLAAPPVPEDPGHAENTLYWLLRLCPDADPALRLAALAHDIQRARQDRLRREDWPDYEAFKAAHAEIGARSTAGMRQQPGIEAEVREEVCRLVGRHEVGGGRRSDLLKDADSLSYFDHNLPLYFHREGWDETLRRARWGYQRVSARARRIYPTIQPADPVLRKLLKEASN